METFCWPSPLNRHAGGFAPRDRLRPIRVSCNLRSNSCFERIRRDCNMSHHAKRPVPAWVLWLTLAPVFITAPVFAQCVDYSNDPAGCQPSTFKTPIGQMPSRRVNRDGKIDSASSEADARAGAAKLEKELHLFRNFEPLHWVLTIPSEKDPATGGWRNGDLDAAGDGRGLGIAGNCIFVGHENGPGKRHPINIFKIQEHPDKEAPVQVGEIPAMFEGNEGFDDRELRGLVYKTSSGQDRYLMVRNGGTNTIGWMQTYGIDMN